MNGLKNAQNASKISTIGLTAATVALNMAISLGLMAAISLAINGFDKLINSAKRASETANTAFEDTSSKVKENEDEAKSLDELIAKYKELKSNENLDIDGRKEVKEVQNDIADLVGTQAKNLDLVNGKLDDEMLNDTPFLAGYSCKYDSRFLSLKPNDLIISTASLRLQFSGSFSLKQPLLKIHSATQFPFTNGQNKSLIFIFLL